MDRKDAAIFAIALISLVVLLVVKPPVDEPEATPEEVWHEIAQITIPDPPKVYAAVPISHETQDILKAACEEWGVPYELALAVCFRETGYKDLETEYDGKHYYGMMAVQLESATQYMEKCGVSDLSGMSERLRVGCCILGDYLSRYDVHLALMCYNLGENRAIGWWRHGIYETEYSRDIVEHWERLKKE